FHPRHHRHAFARTRRHLLLFSRRVARQCAAPDHGSGSAGSRRFRRAAPPSPAQPVNERIDIAVVGSGAAGIAAAVTAARRGRSALLLDSRIGPGGTGGFSGLTTLCGLYDDGGNFLNDGFAREFAGTIRETAPVRMGRLFVLPYRPERFRE